jgi:hypothetical protein
MHAKPCFDRLSTGVLERNVDARSKGRQTLLRPPPVVRLMAVVTSPA